MSSRSEANSRARWAGRVKVVEGRRLAWYGPASTPEAWLDYWKGRMGAGYHDGARRRNLTEHPLGAVLLEELDPEGLHLEAGCGGGFWVAALEHAGYRIEGIESSPGLVDLVRQLEPGLPVRLGDASAIDRPAAHYDSYLSFGVVEHRRDGPEPFLVEAARVLRPAGLLVLSVPHFGPLRRARARLGAYAASPPAGLPFYQYGFTLGELADLVTAAGFVVQRALPIEPHRLLEEESAAYDRLSGRAAGWTRSGAETVLARRDGHMAVVVAHRSPGGDDPAPAAEEVEETAR